MKYVHEFSINIIVKEDLCVCVSMKNDSAQKSPTYILFYTYLDLIYRFKSFESL